MKGSWDLTVYFWWIIVLLPRHISDRRGHRDLCRREEFFRGPCSFFFFFLFWVLLVNSFCSSPRPPKTPCFCELITIIIIFIIIESHHKSLQMLVHSFSPMVSCWSLPLSDTFFLCLFAYEIFFFFFLYFKFFFQSVHAWKISWASCK